MANCHSLQTCASLHLMTQRRPRSSERVTLTGTWSLDTTKRVTYSDKLMGRNPHQPISFADKVRMKADVDKGAGLLKTIQAPCQTDPEVVWFEGVRYVKYDDGDNGYSSS